RQGWERARERRERRRALALHPAGPRRESAGTGREPARAGRAAAARRPALAVLALLLDAAVLALAAPLLAPLFLHPRRRGIAARGLALRGRPRRLALRRRGEPLLHRRVAIADAAAVPGIVLPRARGAAHGDVAVNDDGPVVVIAVDAHDARLAAAPVEAGEEEARRHAD